MSSGILSELFSAIRKNDYEIDSVIIVRNGYVVLESYKDLLEPHFKHQIYSCTKSVSSALIGIAIDKGYIKSVDQPLLELFPEKIPTVIDSNKRKITLRHLLTMAAGLKCEDSVRYEFKGLKEMWQRDDWVQYMIDLPVINPPGINFEYCNGASALLTAIIQKTTGMTAFEFAKLHLFNPLNITDIHWKSYNGLTIGYSDLTMRPLDMARFGYLFLKAGRWNNQQIISPEWIAESTKKHIDNPLTFGYGYQWWIYSPDRFAAVGARGQRIFVLKDKNMVVVFAGNLRETKTRIPEEILDNHIIPAVQSDNQLSEDPRSWERLKSMRLSEQARN
ncbi:MAG: serine hydrolase [Desulfobacterales bacterium]|nr:serine hydrolase [Desulfobacterales bacterium]